MARSRFMIVMAIIWGVSAYAATTGRDYVPSDHSAYNKKVWTSTAGTVHGSVHEVLQFKGKTWLIYQVLDGEETIYIGEYDLDAGTVNHDNSTEMIAASSETGAYDDEHISGSTIGLCSTESATNRLIDFVPGTTATYEFQNIGIAPASISVFGTVGTCPTLQVVPSSFTHGYEDGGTYQNDRIDLQNIGTCSEFTANYEYTNCSLSGTDAFHCEMAVDPDGDTGTEYGHCKLFLVYVGINSEAGLVNPSYTYDWRRLFLAHAQEPDSVWEKHFFTTNTVLGDGDELLSNLNAHDLDTSDPGDTGDYSSMGVPDMLWDEGEDVWRMWFVSHEKLGVGLHFTESADNGLSWGIGGNYAQPTDCYDPTSGGSWDTDACERLEWGLNEPPDNTGSSQDPDAVDPTFFQLDADGDNVTELGMMFTGADRACTGNQHAVSLFAYIDDKDGDQGTASWNWRTNVEADNTDGVILDRNASKCETDDPNEADQITDPTILRLNIEKYIMFYTVEAEIYVAGSGFQCSDYTDNDSDGDVDMADVGCNSPTDDSE